MARAYSEDLRAKVIAAIEAGGGTSEVAARFDLGTATVKRWARRYRETGSASAFKQGGNRPRLLNDEQVRLVDTLVKEHPDWTEEEYTKFLRETHGFKLSRSSIGRVIRRLGYSVKKRPSSRRSEIAHMSENDGKPTSEPSETSPLRVWYLWTKRART